MQRKNTITENIYKRVSEYTALCPICKERVEKDVC